MTNGKPFAGQWNMPAAKGRRRELTDTQHHQEHGRPR
jgi:hypothetical protein